MGACKPTSGFDAPLACWLVVGMASWMPSSRFLALCPESTVDLRGCSDPWLCCPVQSNFLIFFCLGFLTAYLLHKARIDPPLRMFCRFRCFVDGLGLGFFHRSPGFSRPGLLWRHWRVRPFPLRPASSSRPWNCCPLS